MLAKLAMMVQWTFTSKNISLNASSSVTVEVEWLQCQFLIILVLGMTLNCIHRVISLPHPRANDLSCWSAVKHTTLNHTTGIAASTVSVVRLSATDVHWLKTAQGSHVVCIEIEWGQGVSISIGTYHFRPPTSTLNPKWGVQFGWPKLTMRVPAKRWLI